MELSVVVCTRNRLEKLRRCVAAMQNVETSRAWELVIVDNGSTDGTPGYLRELAQLAAMVTVTEPKPGLARARNTGTRATSAPIVAFTDDDCYVAPDFVDQIIRAFAENAPDTGFVAGRVLLFDPRDWPITIQESEERTEFLPRTQIEAGVFHGANLAFRRDALVSIGGFDERLGAGTRFTSGEDLDAASRTLWAGYRGVYDPRPVVSHDHGRRTQEDVDKLVVGYDIGRGAYWIKHLWRSDTRPTYLKAWIAWTIRDLRQIKWSRRPPKRTVRELIGAGSFALEALWHHWQLAEAEDPAPSAGESPAGEAHIDPCAEAHRRRPPKRSVLNCKVFL
jgi:glycosyltransferase involved in cell wall biosynthesis